MRLLIILSVLSCCARVGIAADFDPFEGPKPIAVFIQTNPWAMVIGSDTPRVAVYENGEVIFPKKVGDRLVYHTVTLNKDELNKFRETLKPVLTLKDLKPSYNIRPNATDQPESMFYFRDGDREVATSVYGLMAAGTQLPGFTQFPNGVKPTAPPDELLKLHKSLCELDYKESKEWTPKYVEVMLWDYSYAPGESTPWPKHWPGLNSERAVKRGDAYSVFLDGTELPKLRDFVAKQKNKGAVLADGKKCAMSYRFTFAGEMVWRKALSAAAEKGEKEAEK